MLAAPTADRALHVNEMEKAVWGLSMLRARTPCALISRQTGEQWVLLHLALLELCAVHFVLKKASWL